MPLDTGSLSEARPAAPEARTVGMARSVEGLHLPVARGASQKLGLGWAADSGA